MFFPDERGSLACEGERKRDALTVRNEGSGAWPHPGTIVTLAAQHSLRHLGALGGVREREGKRGEGRGRECGGGLAQPATPRCQVGAASLDGRLGGVWVEERREGFC